MCFEGLRSPQALKCSPQPQLTNLLELHPPDLGGCNGRGVCSQAGDCSPPFGSNPCPSPMDPGPALPLLFKQAPAVASSAPPARQEARCAVWVAQEPWVRRSWLRPGVTGGLVRAPWPPTLSAVRAPSGFPPGPNEYVPLASLCIHCESGETEAHPNPLSLGM